MGRFCYTVEGYSVDSKTKFKIVILILSEFALYENATEFIQSYTTHYFYIRSNSGGDSLFSCSFVIQISVRWFRPDISVSSR